MNNKVTLREFLTKNKGRLYAALPSVFIDGNDKPMSARNYIAECVGIDPNTVYMILTGRLDKTFASDETISAVVSEAIRLLKSNEVVVQEYESYCLVEAVA